MRLVLILVLLLAGCRHAPDPTDPAVGNSNTSRTVTPAVLFFASHETAALLGCAPNGELSAGASCLSTIDGDRVAGDAMGRRFPLGAPVAPQCDAAADQTAVQIPDVPAPEGVAAVDLDTDPRTALIVWPGTRASQIVPATPGGRDRPLDLDVAAAAEVMRATYAPDDDELSVDSALDVDLDGDGSIDRIWAFGRALLARLSTRSGALVPIGDASMDLSLFAGLDVDGDGASELIYTVADDDSWAIVLATYRDGALVEVGWYSTTACGDG